MAHTARTIGSDRTMSTSTNPTIRSRAPRVEYQQKKFPCNKEDCQHFFDTEEEMKQHKKYDPEHFYCKKCDFDAVDWEDLTNHKVENMAPYIEGVKGKVKEPDGDLKHITCEFCGQDFKSFGGRKRHRQQMHPADQDITCPGCQGNFVRASHLIYHLEKGQCSVITARIFRGHMQQKFIVAQIMEAPDKAFQPPRLLTGGHSDPFLRKITDGAETLDQDSGGVSLMDQEDAAQKGGRRPIEAEKNLIDLSAQPNHEAWPRMPGQKSHILTDSMRSMSVTSNNTSAGRKKAGGVSLGGSGSRHSYSYAGSSQTPSRTEEDDDDDTASECTATDASVKGSSGAWGTSQTSRALFPTAKATPRTQPEAGDWEGILAQRNEEAKADTGANMLKIAWWDPQSKDYDVSRFQHPVLDNYFCPFPSCEDAIFENSFDTQSDIESHIKYCHTRTKFRCPQCYKHFDNAASLVAHMEATSKCGIKESGNFKKFLNEVTGGFLKSKYVGEPKIYRPGTALVKSGQPSGGIMSTKFTAVPN